MVRNDLVRTELKIEPLIKPIERQQLKWLVHIVMMGQDMQVEGYDTQGDRKKTAKNMQ